MKIRVLYIPYVRYEETSPVIGHITAASFREAFLKMLTKVRMYTDDDDILAEEEELGRELTQDELLNIIDSQNGDGCDCIISIINEETEEVYFEDGPEYGFEEWYI